MSSRCRDRAARRGVAAVVALAGLVAVGIAGCERESRKFEPPAPGAVVAPPAKDAAALEAETTNAAAMIGRYEHNAYAVSAGKRLFAWYNCSGCHANGGGGSGPALMDDVWIYGGDAGTIYRTIAEGRPNGMPAFGSRIPKDQIWQLAAYVRSMAGLASADAAPNRDDAFLTRTPESFSDPAKPETVTPAAATGRPQ